MHLLGHIENDIFCFKQIEKRVARWESKQAYTLVFMAGELVEREVNHATWRYKQARVADP